MKKTVRIACFFFAFVFIFLSMPFSISAATVMDASSAYSDLVKMKTDLTLYEKNTSDKNNYIMEFMEYAYDAKGNQNDYGLYIYVYNPSCEEILTNSKYNTVQLSVLDSSGNATVSKKCRLDFLSKSTEADGEGLENLYYKFKIQTDSEIVNSVDKERRIYNIVDLELCYSGEVNPRCANISNKYFCTGFQENHGDGKAANYYCWSENLETIEIELHPATWKTKSSDKGSQYQYAVSSVYFSIPDRYLEKYGNMEDKDYKGFYAVRGEWYEYKINGFVTDSVNLCNTVTEYLGVKPEFNDEQFEWGPWRYKYDNTIPFLFFGENIYGDSPIFSKGFNVMNDSFDQENVDKIEGICNSLLYTSSEFKEISSQDLIDVTFREDGTFLYLSEVDAGRKLGHNDYYITVEDGDLNSQIASFGEDRVEWIDWLLGAGSLHEDKGGYDPIKPIKMVTVDDFRGTDDHISNEVLFISEGDIDELQDFYEESEDNDRTTYLMRFAVRDYYFSEVQVYDTDGDMTHIYEDNEHYYFETTMFHNFDVFEYTFRNEEGKSTIVPVSSRPITIVPSITPTYTGPSYFDGVGDFFYDLLIDDDGGLDIASIFKVLIFIAGAIIAIIVIVKLISIVNSARDRSTLRKLKRDENERAWAELELKKSEDRRRESEEKRKEKKVKKPRKFLFKKKIKGPKVEKGSGTKKYESPEASFVDSFIFSKDDEKGEKK